MSEDKNTPFIEEKIDKLNKDAWQIRVNDSIRARELSKEAIDLAESINYARGKAEAYRTFGFGCIRLSMHEEALVYLQKALELFEELDDVKGKTSIYEYFGIIQRSLGNLSASLEYLFKGLELTRQIKFIEGESLSLYHLGVTYKYLGNYEQALEYLTHGLSVARSINYWVSESYCINLIGQIYFENGDYTRALDYYNQSLSLRKSSGDKWGEAGCLDNIGFTHFKLHDYDEANKYCNESLVITEATGDKKGQGNALLHLALIHQQLNEVDTAIEYVNKGLKIRSDISDKKGEAEVLLILAELYFKTDEREQCYGHCLELLDKAMQLAQETQALDLLSDIHFGYYELYKQYRRYAQALLHLETHQELAKQIHTEAVNKKIQNLEISHRVEKSRQEAEIYRLRNIELAQLYEESKRQKDEIEVQKRNVEAALIELKETQKQLIHREKMASLGELTAGIAHEIQNPLNFVNNFSEVNKELIAELKEEIDKGNIEEVKVIAGDIGENEQKINHHGKRADAIVKGMLQHSRASAGKKELTDINALADEYLRLAYHGLRAKDKDFNADFKTDFDESIGKIEVVPQDIGRVLLNLYNNAFYAVNEKKRQLNGTFEPLVSVRTKKSGDKIEISVKDNGTGIPQKVVDKIFQPFFTTKPTGQGTGLGLSLSYDIIKAHGGELKVETKEGVGAAFTIILKAINGIYE